ncbi:protein kinase family protein [Flavobacterium sp.]|uniref:protein kinase family protein n=1 Tax=Flavobacterium sp. TaxID=239 RepID=UPI003F6A4BD2
MKYILSKFITLSKEKNVDIQYLMTINLRKEKRFLINEQLFLFFNKFVIANSFETVLDDYISFLKINDSKDKINLEKILKSFFDDALKNRILVPENTEEVSIDFKPLYEVNDFIDSFRVINVISNNKYVDVYLVEKNNNLFVIKYLNKNKHTSFKKYKKNINSLKDEYSLLSMFDTNLICAAYSLVINDDKNYIVLEYIEGDNLFEYVKNNNLTEKSKISIINQIINAIELIHCKKIIHGDIHFGNIFCTNNLIKFIDFGLSHELNGNQSEEKNGGVHIFIPPERLVVEGKSKFTHTKNFKSEIYQIGIIFYYIVFSKIPFKAYTWNNLVNEKLEYHPENDINIINLKNIKIKKLLINTLKQDYKERDILKI